MLKRVVLTFRCMHTRPIVLLGDGDVKKKPGKSSRSKFGLCRTIPFGQRGSRNDRNGSLSLCKIFWFGV